MPTFKHKVITKRRALKRQATHMDSKGRLYKFVNGSLWMLKGATLWGLPIAYPVYSKVTESTLVKPIKETKPNA